MSETIKQAVARCRGRVLVVLDSNYAESDIHHPVSKPEAKKIIDMAPKDSQPLPKWVGDDLVLQPACRWENS